jgi:23S rRNA G2069 N7-methylase RlmK/C1962 C5-methylase RlmI
MSNGCRLSGLIVDVLGEHVVVASSAAWVERHRATIEHTIGKAIKTSHMSWRPSVEILKEEGLQVDASKESSFDTALDGMDDFEVIELVLVLSLFLSTPKITILS